MKPRRSRGLVTAGVLSGLVMVGSGLETFGLTEGSGGGGEAIETVLTGRVFDAPAGEVVEDGVVVIRGEEIVCAGPRTACEASDEARLKDFGNAMILPGLIDMHVHARPWYAGAFLPSGVTTVRDANNALEVVEKIRGTPGAPRLLASGPLLDGADSRLAAMTGTAGSVGDGDLERLAPILAPDPDAAVEAVEALAVWGVDLVKLYQGLEPEVFAAAAEAAGARGLPVAADVGMLATGGLDGAVDIVDAAQGGASTVEHMSGLALAYQRRGGDPCEEALQEDLLAEIAAAVAATQAAVVPTMANAYQFSEPGSLEMAGLPGSDVLVPWLEESHWPQLLAWASQMPEVAAADGRLGEALLPRLQTRGVPIAAGSDLPAAPYMIPGSALHQELDALVQAGLSPTEALQAATVTAADLLGRDDLGRLERGAPADLVVVDGDPTETILDTRRIEAVWFAGERVDLDAAWTQVEEALAEAPVEGP